MSKKIELLSPAGSFDCLQAAVHAGCDAVYFGVDHLNMRSGSSGSFSIENIKEISAYCRKNGIRSYITLNTVMFEHDMQLLRSILQEVKEQGVDAVIASDFAVIEHCGRMGIPLHVSTQTNVSNLEAVQFFSRYADVVVLARELTLKQVETICSKIKRRDIRGVSGELLKIEVFVHGALCMAVSGKCYLSLHDRNASANRGACVQNCRRPYRVIDMETSEELVVDNEYIMSPKDLCTIGILDQLLNSGVDVLKIEGRSKGPDYVHTVTRCYREALEAIAENSFTREKKEAWLKRLSSVYNRGFWEGNYLGRKMGEWSVQPGSVATEKKIYVGKGSRYYPRIKVAEFIIESGTVRPGDLLMITGTEAGVLRIKMDSLTVNGIKSDVAAKGDKLTFPIGEKVNRQSKLYKMIGQDNG